MVISQETSENILYSFPGAMMINARRIFPFLFIVPAVTLRLLVWFAVRSVVSRRLVFLLLSSMQTLWLMFKLDRHQRKLYVALRVIWTVPRSGFPFPFHIICDILILIRWPLHGRSPLNCSLLFAEPWHQEDGGTEKCPVAWQDHVRLYGRVAACFWASARRSLCPSQRRVPAGPN